MSDDDRRRGAYAPPPDDYETFDARDAEQDRRGWLFLAAAAVVFALFVAVVYNTFQLGVRERSDSPVITADTEPYRVAPEEGDAAQPDLGVHSLRSGERPGGEADAARARAVSEEPIELPEARVETADADELGDEGRAQEPASATRDDLAPAEAQASAASDEPAPDRSGEPGRDRSIEDIIADRERDQDGGPADEPARDPGPAQPERRDSQSDVQSAPEGPSVTAQPYLVQIAAFRSREDAQGDWRRFARAYPELASGKSADIQRADLGDRGIYYRLRINGFATSDAANAYCGQLQSRGQACMVARR